MFEKNYKNAMDNVNPTDKTYDEILNKIALKEEFKNRKNPAVPWRVAFACVACVAIVLGVIFVPKDNFKPLTDVEVSDGKILKVSKSYDEIYKLIKPKKDFNILGNVEIFDEAIDEDFVEYVEEEIEYVTSDNEAMPGGATNGTSTNTNSSTTKGDSNSITDVDDTDFSTTTEQVEGVNEADIVKTDGKYIYYLNDTTLSIVKADGKDSILVSQTELSNAIRKDLYGEMFLKDDRIIILKTEYYASASNLKDDAGSSSPYVMYDYNGYDQKVLIEIYDISNKSNPKKVAESCQDGTYYSSRMVGDYIYLISNCHINTATMDKNDPTTFVPTTTLNGACEPVPADSIYRYEDINYESTSSYTVIGAFNYLDGTMSDTASLLGGTDNIYCSQGNIILADAKYNNRYNDKNEAKQEYTVESTIVSKLAISGGQIEYETSGAIDGILENQFFIDEHKGYFRFVTTVTKSAEQIHKFANSDNEVVSYSFETFAQLTVLDNELKKVGEIGDLAQGESVYSVRFMGDVGYFVTFRQTDPLFSVDLSDPTNPKILGELKIPGFSEYMYPYGDGLLLGFGMDADENTGRTGDLKLSMFNIADPVNATEQDKTTVDGYRYSPALSNHKAMLVSPSKNLIGFAVTQDWQNQKYMIYEYTGQGFVCKAVLDINNEYSYYAMTDVRGLFVGESFYAVSDLNMQVFDINTFEQIGKINF